MVRISRLHRIRTLAGAAALGIAAAACGPRARIPPLPRSVPGALAPEERNALLARQIAPVLYLQRDEWFQLSRVVAVVHPRYPVVAYHMLWRDDVVGAWVPFTKPTDQEIAWVGYDDHGTPADLWTYWHGDILHADWRGKGQVVVDVQWGKHGSLPHGVADRELPPLKGLGDFYLISWMLPDMWLGRLNRAGPLCFCAGPDRYRDFSRPLLLARHIDVVIEAEEPHEALAAVFGTPYSRKPAWPWLVGGGSPPARERGASAP